MFKYDLVNKNYTISFEDICKIEDRLLKLEILEECGVDKWEDYLNYLNDLNNKGTLRNNNE